MVMTLECDDLHLTVYECKYNDRLNLLILKVTETGALFA